MNIVGYCGIVDCLKMVSWCIRYDILLGIVNGFVYLYEEFDFIYVYGGIKVGNIMLDKIMKLKIVDWGLVVLFCND